MFELSSELREQIDREQIFRMERAKEKEKRRVEEKGLMQEQMKRQKELESQPLEALEG